MTAGLQTDYDDKTWKVSSVRECWRRVFWGPRRCYMLMRLVSRPLSTVLVVVQGPPRLDFGDISVSEPGRVERGGEERASAGPVRRSWADRTRSPDETSRSGWDL